MKLTLTELREITKGCLELWESDAGVRFRRMTEKQLAAVDDIPRYRLRSRFCAGVRFDFWTDAREPRPLLPYPGPG